LKLLVSMMEQDDVVSFLGQRHITWKFIAQRAAWWGGFWERLVGLTKQHLLRVVRKSCLNFEESTTILSETEAILNSRPLTCISDDVNDISPLTRGHFLIGRRLTTISRSHMASFPP